MTLGLSGFPHLRFKTDRNRAFLAYSRRSFAEIGAGGAALIAASGLWQPETGPAVGLVALVIAAPGARRARGRQGTR